MEETLRNNFLTYINTYKSLIDRGLHIIREARIPRQSVFHLADLTEINIRDLFEHHKELHRKLLNAFNRNWNRNPRPNDFMQKLEDFMEDVLNYIDFIQEFTHTLEDDMTFMKTNRNYNEILFDTH